MSNRCRILTHALVALSLPLAASAAKAQDKYPSRPIEVVVPFGPGGGADLMGRQFAKLAESRLKVGMPVVNIGGASGNAGLTRVATNPADGYTIGLAIALTVSAWASGVGNLKPDQFQIIAVMQDSPSMLFVPKSSPFKTFKDMLEHAKANPGKLRVATSGFGTMDDITLKFFESKGFKMTNVPFAKPAERYASTVGAHTDAIYEEPGDVAQFLASGDLRPLIVFDDERHASFKDVPTTKELGYQINDLPNFRTIAVRAGTPKEVADRLTAVAVDVLGTPEWKAFCKKTYTCTKIRTGAEAQKHVTDFHTKVTGYLKTFPAKK